MRGSYGIGERSDRQGRERQGEEWTYMEGNVVDKLGKGDAGGGIGISRRIWEERWSERHELGWEWA